MNKKKQDKQTFKPGDKFIRERGKRQLDEYEIAGTDYYIRISLLKKLVPYNPKEQIAKIETYTDDQGETWNVCECGTDVTIIYNYCPECGKKLIWNRDKR